MDKRKNYFDFIELFKPTSREDSKDIIDAVFGKKTEETQRSFIDLQYGISIVYDDFCDCFKTRKKDFLIFSSKDGILLINKKNDFAIKIEVFPEYIFSKNFYLFSNVNKEYLNELTEDLHAADDFMPTKCIYLLTRDSQGHLDLLDFEFDGTVLNSKDMQSNYNNDFIDFDKTVSTSLSELDRPGVVIMHGPPGTGKSTYIKHLISTVDRNFIYVPKDMLPDFASPSFVGLLQDMKNYIIILEDAEDLIRSRNNSSNSFIDTLLNLSDGILGDVFKLKFIITFNADINTVDDALIRKGRMIARYEFGKLSPEKSEALIKKIHKKTEKIKEPMALSDILFYENKTNFSEKKNGSNIGFQNNKG